MLWLLKLSAIGATIIRSSLVTHLIHEESCLKFGWIYNWLHGRCCLQSCRLVFLPQKRLSLRACHRHRLVSLRHLLHVLSVGVLRVVTHGQGHLISKNLFDADATASFNLLLRPLLMLLSHVHDCSSLGAIILVTVETLELLVDLVCGAADLARTTSTNVPIP